MTSDRLKSYTIRISLSRDGVEKHYMNTALGISANRVCMIEVNEWAEMLDLVPTIVIEDGLYAHAMASDQDTGVKLEVRVS